MKRHAIATGCQVVTVRTGDEPSGESRVLATWNDGDARRAIVEFVEQRVADAVPVEERIAVFDNDGTLWCEKPMPIQADFILRRLAEMAEADPEPARPPALEGRVRARLRLARQGARRALRGRRHERADAPGRRPRRVRRASASRTSRPSRTRSCATTQHPTLGRGVPRMRRTRRWSSCSATWRRTASRTTSPRAAAATSCGRSARRCTASRASG